MAKLMKFYFDLLSQPSRALYMFLEANQIPYTPVMLSLMKGDHLKTDFKDINRFRKLPCIEDNGLKLSESVAIMRYLTREKLVPEHWYPKNTQKRAQIDEYLEWQHSNIRLGCSMYAKTKYILPMKGQPANAEQLALFEGIMKNSLDTFENVWLNHSDRFLFGSEVTIADLLAASEIEQPRIAGFDPCDGRPRIRAYMKDMKKKMHPYYEEANVVIDEITEQPIKLKVHRT